MTDIGRYIGAVTREVQSRRYEGLDCRVVIATRSYDTDPDDLWDALTNAERIPRWFLPIEGDLRLGGRFQFKGNAGGEILRCDAPKELMVTWGMGGDGPGSWVIVRLAPDGEGRTRLELEHIAPVDEAFWAQFGPGAVGVGWDGGLYGLALHIETGASMSPEAAEDWMRSEEGKDFYRRTSEEWRKAAVAWGMDPQAAQAAADRTSAFYRGEA